MEEGRRISRLQWERYKAQQTEHREELGDAFKSAALKWLKKQIAKSAKELYQSI